MSSRSEASFCVTGDTLTKISAAAIAQSHKKNPHIKMDVDEKTVLLHPAAQAVLMDLVPIISVFARHAPRQKEAVIAAFNHAGKYTLMVSELIDFVIYLRF
jgi:cation-transporting ATPase 13A1